MSRATRKIIAPLLLALVGGALFTLAKSRKLPAPTEPTKRVRYTLEAHNTSGEALERSEFVVFAPLAETAHQRVLDLTATQPYTASRDELGNEALHFMLTVAPYGTQVISVEAELALSAAPRGQAAPSDVFLADEPLLNLASPELQRLGAELRAPSTRETARKIFEWVSANIRPRGFDPQDRGALYAFRERTGDCTEFATLFVALARLNGIPARVIGGFVVRSSPILRSDRYHNWAEFYEHATWQIADPLEGRFAEQGTDYLAFRVYSRAAAAPASNSHRFLAFDSRLEVRME